jgi:hypothetical protein
VRKIAYRADKHRVLEIADGTAVTVAFCHNSTEAARIVHALTQLDEAEWLIRELDGHEGAEGWSEYLRKRLDAYQFSTEKKK